MGDKNDGAWGRKVVKQQVAQATRYRKRCYRGSRGACPHHLLLWFYLLLMKRQ